MYIEAKADGLDGPGRIGWVTLSKSRRTYFYVRRRLAKVRYGYKVQLRRRRHRRALLGVRSSPQRRRQALRRCSADRRRRAGRVLDTDPVASSQREPDAIPGRRLDTHSRWTPQTSRLSFVLGKRQRRSG